MRRECRERSPSQRLQRKLHMPWCMTGSLTSCKGKRSRHSRRMRNTQFYLSGKRPTVWTVICLPYHTAHPFHLSVPDLHISSSDTYMMIGYRDSNPSNGHQATCLIVTKSIMGMVDYFSHQIELRKMHLENMHAVSMLSRGHYPKWKKKQQNKGGLVSLYHPFAYPLFIHGHHVSMTDTPKTRIGFKFMQNPLEIHISISTFVLEKCKKINSFLNWKKIISWTNCKHATYSYFKG